MSAGNFNTDVELWRNLKRFRDGQKRGGENITPLTIIDGHVLCGGEVLGRFKNDDAAKDALNAAGFKYRRLQGWV